MLPHCPRVVGSGTPAALPVLCCVVSHCFVLSQTAPFMCRSANITELDFKALVQGLGMNPMDPTLVTKERFLVENTEEMMATLPLYASMGSDPAVRQVWQGAQDWPSREWVVVLWRGSVLCLTLVPGSPEEHRSLTEIDVERAPATRLKHLEAYVHLLICVHLDCAL